MASVNGRAVSVVPARAAGARPRRDYWRGVVEACRRSGMSQAAFCRRRGLSSGTLGYWKCILAREARPGRSPARLEPKPPAFLPVRIAGPPPRPAAMSGAPPASRGELEIALGHGRLVRVRGRVDAQWLGAVIAVLEARRC